MAVHEVRVDRSKTLVEEPTTGHNRWHPDIAPIVRCEPGDEVVLETRDAFDGQMGPQSTLGTVAAPNLDVVHPLTGPVYVTGAQPGDLLEVEILEVTPDSYGYTLSSFGTDDHGIGDQVMHGQLETASGLTLMAADMLPGETLRPGNNLAVSLGGDDTEELRGYWQALSDGGTVTVELATQPWGDEFGMCVDRFGTSWLVNIAGGG